MDKITIWEKYCYEKDKDGKIVKTTIEHNHIEFGWVDGDYPMPLGNGEDFVKQKNWKNSKWVKKLGYMENNKVILKNGI